MKIHQNRALELKINLYLTSQDCWTWFCKPQGPQIDFSRPEGLGRANRVGGRSAPLLLSASVGPLVISGQAHENMKENHPRTGNVSYENRHVSHENGNVSHIFWGPEM